MLVCCTRTRSSDLVKLCFNPISALVAVHAHELASFECVLYLSNSWQHFSPHKVWQGLCGINRTLTWWSPYFSYGKVFLCWSVNPVTETTIASSNMWVHYEPTPWEMYTCAVPSLCEYWRSQSCTPNGLGQSLVLASRWNGEVRCMRLQACFLTIRIRGRAALEKNGKWQGRRRTSWLQSRRIVIKHCLVPITYMQCSPWVCSHWHRHKHRWLCLAAVVQWLPLHQAVFERFSSSAIWKHHHVESLLLTKASSCDAMWRIQNSPY